jgi:UDP-N-acetylglucosamine 4-epimerase
MNQFETIQRQLRRRRTRWLVTGGAGFIGSHLVEKLLLLGQHVVVLDNFATGKRENLVEVRANVSPAQWARFTFLEGDVRRLDDCHRACAGVDYVLHQAALGSVPRSLEDPLRSHESNVDGFINMLVAARDADVRRLVYASSSSVYGDHSALPKIETQIGRPLSPYAATKLINEIYADVFSRCYGLAVTGLRYFNVFGARQDPEGAYAAVIPKWFATIFRGEAAFINGDGETSRDFCYIANVVQANLLAAMVERPASRCDVYNVACGDRTTLRQLFALLQALAQEINPDAVIPGPVLRSGRPGDVRHSHADIAQARKAIGYRPTHSLAQGLAEASCWYLARMEKVKSVGARRKARKDKS